MELNHSSVSAAAEEDPVFHSWDEFDLPSSLLRGIYAHGFEKPSPIQSKAIYPILQGRDLIAQAQSGTGKTGCFAIGLLSRINPAEKTQQALVLAPTHELAHQIASVISSLATMMEGVVVQTLVGGSAIDQDAQQMRTQNPCIVVGCPGRVYDMIRRKHLNPSGLKLVVLDEADELLSSGFKEQVYNIFSVLHSKVQIVLFSATLPVNIFTITNQFMRNPVQICVKAESLTLEGIKQYFIAINDDHEKYETLKDLYQHITLAQCIIYSNSVKRVSDLYDAMKQDGFPVGCLHRHLDHAERTRVFQEFRQGATRVLISSNVTCRGIDVQQVSVVINFDLPQDVHTYLHRIGRSGRWGRKGTCINLLTRKDVGKMKEIEAYYATQIEELPSQFTL